MAWQYKVQAKLKKHASKGLVQAQILGTKGHEMEAWSLWGHRWTTSTRPHCYSKACHLTNRHFLAAAVLGIGGCTKDPDS
jgi:hypothetical protein